MSFVMLSVGQKLTAGFAGVVTLTLVLAVVSVGSIDSRGGRMGRTMRKANTSSDLASSINSGINDMKAQGGWSNSPFRRNRPPDTRSLASARVDARRPLLLKRNRNSTRLAIACLLNTGTPAARLERGTRSATQIRRIRHYCVVQSVRPISRDGVFRSISSGSCGHPRQDGAVRKEIESAG